jgi:hypothetical protein
LDEASGFRPRGVVEALLQQWRGCGHRRR